jgi:hypothetical protein
LIHFYKRGWGLRRMPSRVILVGGNLVSDSDFRKRLAGRDAAVEAQMVLEDLLPNWNPEDSSTNDNEALLVEKEDSPPTVGVPEPERDQLKITLKIFLHDFDASSLLAAVQAALNKLSTNRVDTLFLATPVEAIPLLGIGSGAVGPGQEEARDQLIRLWRAVEQLIKEGKVVIVKVIVIVIVKVIVIVIVIVRLVGQGFVICTHQFLSAFMKRRPSNQPVFRST